MAATTTTPSKATATTVLVVLAAVLGLAAALPDLTLDAARLAASVTVETHYFPSSSCAFQEGCVRGTGQRRLIKFDTVTPNIGSDDLYLGTPPGPRLTAGDFIWDECHYHHHWIGYANYKITPPNDDTTVTVGLKQAFCLLDSSMYGGYTGPRPAYRQYTCSNQGISRGWQDVYGRYLDCQWIDVTGVPNGDYVLHVELNAADANGNRRIAEERYDNNKFSIPIRLSDGGVTGDPNTCQVSQWTSWSACSVACGGGVRTRTRSVTGGANCGASLGTESCNTHSCDTGNNDDGGNNNDGGNNDGGNTGGPYTISTDGRCGSNSPTNSICAAGFCCSQYGWCGQSDAHCAGTSPSDGNTNPGGDAGAGDVCTGCAAGSAGYCKDAQSVCHDYRPGTTQCPGGTVACSQGEEDHDCLWGPWGPWSECDAECGGGEQWRARVVDVPQSGAGEPCAGVGLEERNCNTDACDAGDPDVDCSVSDWAAWSPCDVECGGGTTTRRRTVAVPPSGNGAACPSLEQSVACNSHSCPDTGSDQCANCLPGTSGPCQYNGACYNYMPSTTQCWPGTSKCAEAGSAAAEPAVETELTVAGITVADVTTTRKFLDAVAESMELNPNTLSITSATPSVTRNEHASGSATARRLHGGPPIAEGTEAVDLKIKIVAASQLGMDPNEVASALQKVLGDGALERKLNNANMPVTATQMDTDNVVIVENGVADHTPAGSSAATSAASAGTGTTLSALAIALIAVGAAVVGAGIAGAIVAHRVKSKAATRARRIDSSRSVVPRQ